MGDFLTSDEVASVLGTTVNEDQVDLLIEIAEGAVRTFCGWNITEETVTEQVVEPVGGVIFLPTLHLTAVSAVVEGGSTLTVGSSYTWTRDGLIRRTYGRWSADWQAVTVTYTHGYPAGSPQLLAVKQVVLAMVSRLLQAPNPMLQSLQVGGISESFAVPPQVPSGLLYAEQGALAPFALSAVA